MTRVAFEINEMTMSRRPSHANKHIHTNKCDATKTKKKKAKINANITKRVWKVRISSAINNSHSVLFMKCLYVSFK